MNNFDNIDNIICNSNYNDIKAIIMVIQVMVMIIIVTVIVVVAVIIATNTARKPQSLSQAMVISCPAALHVLQHESSQRHVGCHIPDQHEPFHVPGHHTAHDASFHSPRSPLEHPLHQLGREHGLHYYVYADAHAACRRHLRAAH